MAGAAAAAYAVEGVALRTQREAFDHVEACPEAASHHASAAAEVGVDLDLGHQVRDRILVGAVREELVQMRNCGQGEDDLQDRPVEESLGVGETGVALELAMEEGDQ